MVRASRNVSNLRRAAAGDPWAELERLNAEADPRRPLLSAQSAREMRAGARGAGRVWARSDSLPVLAALEDRDPPPGAALDDHGWARSWGSFLGAIRDKDDRLGARAACAKAMEASRPRNALGERVPAEGGFLVPERLRQVVLSYMQTGIVMPRCTVVEMDSLRVPIPVLDNPSQASGAQALGGLTWSFTPEGQAIAATTPNFGRVALEAWPDKALLKNVPNEFLADATPFTEDFLPRVVAEGLSWHVDDMALYQGTGAGQPQALVNAPAAVAVTRNPPSGFHVGHIDVVTMLKSLHPASKCCAVWLASEDVFDQLLELYEIIGSAPSGQEIPPPQTLVYNSQAGRWELLGLEIVTNDHQPAAGTAGDLMLADMSLLLLGERSAMTVETAAGTAFASDQSYIRFVYRWDARYWPQSSYTTSAGKVVSPLVVLH